MPVKPSPQILITRLLAWGLTHTAVARQVEIASKGHHKGSLLALQRFWGSMCKP